jgi:hypothetical protein
MKIRRLLLLLVISAEFLALPSIAKAQTLADSGTSSGTAASTFPVHLDLAYKRPTTTTKLHNYLFDAFGPYPIANAAVAAGINQESNSPPEWNQGVRGYSKRFGSNFAIIAVSTTTRYALAEAFREDTLYYRCECKGTLPRLGHAVISTFTARRGDDGHRVFSIPALVAPYAGTMTAVYAWYPNRYGAEDAFRLGNYSMLGYIGQNIVLEFFHTGPHSLLSRMHLDNRHGAADPQP